MKNGQILACDECPVATESGTVQATQARRKCIGLDDDVLTVAIHLQQCKQGGRRSGQVVVCFDPHGKINLQRILWITKGREVLSKEKP